jgi:MSHA biogenesis protein MshO
MAGAAMKLTASPRRQRGFSLVELVITIAVMGVVAGFAAQLVGGIVSGQQDTRNRLNMAQQAESAMGRVRDELNSSLPNSLRLSSASGGTWVEFVPVADAGRYRQAPDLASGTPGDPWDPVDTADSSFDVLGVPLATPGAEVQLVVANLGSPDADVYLGTSRRGGVSVAAGGQMLSFQPTLPMPAALGTSRFFLVTEPITVACVPDAGGSFSLVRFSGYGWQGVQPASTAALGGAQQAVLMEGLQRCSMTYSTALANIGLLNLALGLGEAGGATHMDLLHQVALDNTP